MKITNNGGGWNIWKLEWSFVLLKAHCGGWQRWINSC